MNKIKFIQPFRKDNRVYRFAITASSCATPEKRVVISAHTSLAAAQKVHRTVKHNPDFRIEEIDVGAA